MDLARSFPYHYDFDFAALKRILRAISHIYEHSAGYCQGMNYIAGMLLLHVSGRIKVSSYTNEELRRIETFKPDDEISIVDRSEFLAMEKIPNIITWKQEVTTYQLFC